MRGREMLDVKKMILRKAPSGSSWAKKHRIEAKIKQKSLLKAPSALACLA